MAVGDFQLEFQRSAADRGVNLDAEQVLPWLSGLGHAEPEAQDAPQAVLDRLAEIHDALGGDESLLRGKRRQPSRVDFLAQGQIIVELDEFQHFTSARLLTLDFYDGVEHGFEVDLYRRLCYQNVAKADAYRASKPAKDFPFPGGRRAQRAYLDMCRDLLGPAFGFRVIRIAAPQLSVAAAIGSLTAQLEAG
jgi:hypothetical protein